MKCLKRFLLNKKNKKNKKQKKYNNIENIIVCYYMKSNQSINSQSRIKMNGTPISTLKYIQNTPLILFQPFNIVVFLSFFSPIIIATIITATSFMLQNANGFVYLGFLLAAIVLRSFLYMISGFQSMTKTDGSICTSVQYSKYGNSTFSSFVNAFTIMYLSLPMFINDNINYFVFSILISYFFFDVFVKVYKKCIGSYADLTLNVLFGLSFGAIIVTLMYVGGSGKYLFFDTSLPNYISNSANGIKCNMPSKQTFKCSVYKNGQLVNSTTTS